MNKFDLYKSFYDQENLRRETLNNSVGIPLAILSGLIAAIVYLSSNFINNSNLFCLWIFVFIISISVLLLIVAIIYLSKSFTNLINGYNYKEIAFLSEIEVYYLELKKYYKDDKGKAKNKFIKYLQGEFVKYADLNCKINDRRSYDLYKTKQFLFLSVIAIALACIPYGINKYKSLQSIVPVQNELKVDNLQK